MGQPHRIAHLASALDYILSHPDVWCATASEIVAAARPTPASGARL
jgi:hypothetical protein